MFQETCVFGVMVHVHMWTFFFWKCRVMNIWGYWRRLSTHELSEGFWDTCWSQIASLPVKRKCIRDTSQAPPSSTLLLISSKWKHSPLHMGTPMWKARPEMLCITVHHICMVSTCIHRPNYSCLVTRFCVSLDATDSSLSIKNLTNKTMYGHLIFGLQSVPQTCRSFLERFTKNIRCGVQVLKQWHSINFSFFS